MSTPADPASTPPVETPLQRFVEHGREQLGRRDLRLFFAPGRVNLMGAHLDYNGGPVMPTSVDRGTWILAGPRDDGRVRMQADGQRESLDCGLDELSPQAVGSWFDYPAGVLRALRQRHPGTPGIDLHFGGDLPIGAGLSSSASICVGTALALETCFELSMEPQDRVTLALEAERGYVGVQCGIMDPFAVAFSRPGHLLWLDCKDESIDHVPLDPERVTIAVADSGVRRELAQGAFNERVEQCRRAFAALRRASPGSTCLRDIRRDVLDAERGRLAPVDARRAQHVVDEVDRAFAARRALERGDLAGFGRRMTESHASLRLLYEVSIRELDVLVRAAVSTSGVLGSRLTGAGFGGCTVVLLERGRERHLEASLREAYQREFGRVPTLEFFHGDPGPRELTLD